MDELITKLTPLVYDRALGLRAMGEVELLPGFDKLSPREVALLPPMVQIYVPTISCAQIGRATPPPGRQAVACSGDYFKLLLDKAAIGGSDVAGVTTGREPVTGMYEAKLQLKVASLSKWSTVSAEAANGVDCERAGSDNHCLLAFMVDGEVLTAPEILRPLTDDEAVITFETHEQARLVAATLGPRELPPGVKLTS